MCFVVFACVRFLLVCMCSRQCWCRCCCVCWFVFVDRVVGPVFLKHDLCDCWSVGCHCMACFLFVLLSMFVWLF